MAPLHRILLCQKPPFPDIFADDSDSQPIRLPQNLKEIIHDALREGDSYIGARAADSSPSIGSKPLYPNPILIFALQFKRLLWFVWRLTSPLNSLICRVQGLSCSLSAAQHGY